MVYFLLKIRNGLATLSSFTVVCALAGEILPLSIFSGTREIQNFELSLEQEVFQWEHLLLCQLSKGGFPKAGHTLVDFGMNVHMTIRTKICMKVLSTLVTAAENKHWFDLTND